MKDIKKLLYVAERDVDLVLLEELNVNQEFSGWLYTRSFDKVTSVPMSMGAWHSVTHPQLGESDLVVIYQNGSAILIENKVDAPAQPEQAARYQSRGREGLKDGAWNNFITCIVAPERYLKGNSEAQQYDIRISYEQVRDWFNGHESTRHIYRAKVFDDAIEQNRRGYLPVADENVTSFWQSYWELARSEFPVLKMPRPGIKPANSDWPDFRPSGLGNGLNIVHKMAQGFVDLQIRGAAERLDEIRSWVNGFNLDVVVVGKSAAVRVTVPQVDRFESFDGQRSNVLKALQSAQTLYHIGKKLRVRI